MSDQEQRKRSLQDIMAGELFASSRSDIVETLRFLEKHGTPLTQRQVAAVALLRSIQGPGREYEPIIKVMQDMAKDMTSPNLFVDLVEKMTLGGFVSGKLRLNKMFGGEGGK